MPVSALFLLNSNGTALIGRNYRGDPPDSAIEIFTEFLRQNEDISSSVPIFCVKNVSFAFIPLEDIYLVCVISKNANISLIFTFMYRFVDVLKNYLTKIEEESIKDNFVIIYELLDEIMDDGYPQTTDKSILQRYITQESHKLTKSVPAVLTNIVSWRPEGLKYHRNELFIDVVESVNLSVNAKGVIVKNEVFGCVKMKVHLSGMPQLRLGLSDKTLMLAINSLAEDAVRFEDVKFHQCVQLSRLYDKDIYFIPPDGDFELMSYRLNIDLKPLILVESRVEQTQSRISYTIKAIAQFRKSSVANDVELVLPVHPEGDSPTIRTSAGVANYVPEKVAVVWRMKYFPGGAEMTLNVTFKLSSFVGEVKQDRIPVHVHFTIPYFTVSGLSIKFIRIIERSNYKALTWVRYNTKGGDYFFAFR